jgi:hypothetical protein
MKPGTIRRVALTAASKPARFGGRIADFDTSPPYARSSPGAPGSVDALAIGALSGQEPAWRARARRAASSTTCWAMIVNFVFWLWLMLRSCANACSAVSPLRLIRTPRA